MPQPRGAFAYLFEYRNRFGRNGHPDLPGGSKPIRLGHLSLTGMVIAIGGIRDTSRLVRVTDSTTDQQITKPVLLEPRDDQLICTIQALQFFRVTLTPRHLLHHWRAFLIVVGSFIIAFLRQVQLAVLSS